MPLAVKNNPSHGFTSVAAPREGIEVRLLPTFALSLEFEHDDTTRVAGIKLKPTAVQVPLGIENKTWICLYFESLEANDSLLIPGVALFSRWRYLENCPEL